MPPLNETDLADLMTCAQDGDGAAYATLLERVLPVLKAMARKKIADPDRAEDVVQEILLSVHGSRHTYEPDRPFMPWLHAIAQRRIADYLRTHYRRQNREQSVAEYPETFSADGPKDYEEGALAYAASHTLQAALAQLPEGQRKAVELLKLQDMTLAEAEQASGMSVPALKVSMHRAMKGLRKLLDVKVCL